MDDPAEPVSNEWNSDSYDGDHSFVYEYGEGVVDLLGPEPDERILDLGCGTGHLTRRIADSGAEVIGLDSSESMLESARREHPDLTFRHGDARSFTDDRPFDAVFSNAALHWIPEQDAVLTAVATALKPGGRFVAELGGDGNVAAVVGAVSEELRERGYEASNPWYFPTVGEYTTKLEAHGFKPRHVALFDRPTVLEGGEDGLANWLELFGDGLLGPVPAEERSAVIEGVEDRLRGIQYDDGTWTADYRRLRFAAVLEEERGTLR